MLQQRCGLTHFGPPLPINDGLEGAAPLYDKARAALKRPRGCRGAGSASSDNFARCSRLAIRTASEKSRGGGGDRYLDSGKLHDYG